MIVEEKLERILLAIQEFDPAGIAARDLRECLMLQLSRKEGKQYELAKHIVKDFFVEFTKKHYDKISSKTLCFHESKVYRPRSIRT